MFDDDDQAFELHSVWEREYTESYWVVFYVCAVHDTYSTEDGRRVARVLANQDPQTGAGTPPGGTFRFDPSWPFGRKCKRIA